MQQQRSETWIELLMTAILPALGSLATIVLLHTYTPWPLWLCTLVGLPAGAVAAWTLMLGIICTTCNVVLEPLARLWAPNKEVVARPAR